jgi:hypothetical protein
MENLDPDPQHWLIAIISLYLLYQCAVLLVLLIDVGHQSDLIYGTYCIKDLFRFYVYHCLFSFFFLARLPSLVF